mgnify:FL=1
MLAGFRLLCRDAAEGRFLIRYRNREMFAEYGSDRWRTLASYATKEERDRMFDRLLQDDVWTVEVSLPEPERYRIFAEPDPAGPGRSLKNK